MLSKISRQYQSPFWSGGTNPTITEPFFQFDSVSPGFVWTGTVSLCAATMLTQGSMSANPPGSDTHNDIISNMIWTLYRNTQPEMTWIGLSQAVNVQLYNNDSVVVTGFLPGAGISPNFENTNPIGLVCNFIGYIGDVNEVTPVVPYVTGSTDAVPNAAVATPAKVLPAEILTTSFGTYSLIAGPLSSPYANIRLWSASLAMAVVNAAGNTAAVQIFDNVGVNYLSFGIAGEGSLTQSVEMHGIVVPATSLPLNFRPFNVVGAATQLVASCSIFYSVETIV